MSRIAIVQGHPDPAGDHLCHSLATAYAEGARDAGNEVDALTPAAMKFPFIVNKDDFENGPRPDCIVSAQKSILDAQHIVLVYPLWHGTMPALLKSFLEQVFRYDFAFEPLGNGRYRKKLGGRSARIVVTMGMPALAYRWYFRAHGLKNLERNILKFSGIGPVRETLFGMVDNQTAKGRQRWHDKLRKLGRAAR